MYSEKYLHSYINITVFRIYISIVLSYILLFTINQHFLYCGFKSPEKSVYLIMKIMLYEFAMEMHAYFTSYCKRVIFLYNFMVQKTLSSGNIVGTLISTDNCTGLTLACHSQKFPPVLLSVAQIYNNHMGEAYTIYGRYSTDIQEIRSNFFRVEISRLDHNFIFTVIYCFATKMRSYKKSCRIRICN